MSCVTIFSFFFQESGEASQLRVCYQRGLPRLVSNIPRATPGYRWVKQEAKIIGQLGENS